MTKVLLKDIDTPHLHEIDNYEKKGGYEGLKIALKKFSPDNLVDEVKISGLRGRGGAGFPTGLKWSFLSKSKDSPHYLICNADESEPGTFKDRFLMNKHPHLLIEGMVLASYALQAHTAYIYIRGEMMGTIPILEKAIQQAYRKGYLGKNILNQKYDLDIFVHPGAGAYICGEETALIESLEGKRGNPRIKPPFPAVSGLYNCPTVVNNVETLACLPWIVTNGGKSYAEIGTGQSAGTKLISACGNVAKPGVYEVAMGLSVQEFIYSQDYCGGMAGKKKLKAVVPGGSSVPILPANLILKTATGNPRLISYESLSDGGFKQGTMLGSGGFIVFDEDACIVRNTWNFLRFYRHESCGQCSPCREGTGWLEKILYDIEHGKGNKNQIDYLVNIANNIEGNTICPLGEAAAWPVQSAVRHFRDEFQWHVDKPQDCLKQNFGIHIYDFEHIG